MLKKTVARAQGAVRNAELLTKKEKAKDRPRGNTACPEVFGESAKKIAKRLLEFDLGAGGLELLLDFLGIGLGSAFLDGLRRAFDEILGFL